MINLLIHKLLVLLMREYLLQFDICFLHVLHGFRSCVADCTFGCKLEVHAVQRIAYDTIYNI